MAVIKIDPLDTLFFRDGRPFTMGEDDWAVSVFPPSPGVIYGALRSLYFSYHTEELSLAQTDADPTVSLRITAMYWLMGPPGSQYPYFPLPLDLVRRKNSRQEPDRYYRLELRSLNDVATGFSLPWVLGSGEEVENGDNCMVSKETLADYLAGNRDTFFAKEMKQYLYEESRIGIGRNTTTRAAEEHRLYRIKMHRLKEMSLAVEYEGLTLPGEGFLRLGGEGRVARYTHLSGDKEVLLAPVTGRYFKLYLATPAFFAAGWRPGWLNPDGAGAYGPLKIRLLTAAVGRPLYIGGFDIKEKRPKPMRRAAPPGSVYYCEILQGSMAEVVKAFHGRCIAEYRQKEGFGLAFVGKLDQKNLSTLASGGGDINAGDHYRRHLNVGKLSPGTSQYRRGLPVP